MRFGVEFGLQVRLVATAHACAVGATALRHETGDHTVELDPVVKAFIGQFGDACDMARRKVGAQLDDDVAAFSVAGVEGEGKRIGHGNLLIGCCASI